MDAKRFLTGTIVGGIVLFATGYVIFTVTFAAFYAANAGTATGVDRGNQLVWAVALGSLAYAALITFAMGNRPGTCLSREARRSGQLLGSYCGSRWISCFTVQPTSQT